MTIIKHIITIINFTHIPFRNIRIVRNITHSLNIEFRFVTLEVFHLEISGNDIKEAHLKNIKLKF